MVKLQLKKFNMREMANDSVVVMVGRRRTGKSQLATDALFHHKDFPVGIVISGTEKANHYYEKFVPKFFIYDEWTSDTVKKFLNRQEKITNQYNEEIKKYGKTDIDPRAFIILDDFLFDNSWVNDKNMRYIAMNGRHLHIFAIICLQYVLGVPPSFRTNVDYVFIMRENYLANRRKLYEGFAGMFPSFEVFCSVMDQATENYECLVIDNNKKSNKLEEQVYWYKADMHPSFHSCSPEFWDMQAIEDERKRTGTNIEDDNEDDFDMAKIAGRKKNSPVIHVRKQG
jgi:hypothetical protein